jgi:hypothetical protein
MIGVEGSNQLLPPLQMSFPSSQDEMSRGAITRHGHESCHLLAAVTAGKPDEQVSHQATCKGGQAERQHGYNMRACTTETQGTYRFNRTVPESFDRPPAAGSYTTACQICSDASGPSCQKLLGTAGGEGVLAGTA